MYMLWICVVYQVCAIVGGIFTVAGIIDSIAFTVSSVLKKAHTEKLNWYWSSCYFLSILAISVLLLLLSMTLFVQQMQLLASFILFSAVLSLKHLVDTVRFANCIFLICISQIIDWQTSRLHTSVLLENTGHHTFPTTLYH